MHLALVLQRSEQPAKGRAGGVSCQGGVSAERSPRTPAPIPGTRGAEGRAEL